MKFSEKKFDNNKKLGTLNRGDYFIDGEYHYIVTDDEDVDDVLVVCLEDGETIWMNTERVVEQIYVDEFIFHIGGEG